MFLSDEIDGFLEKSSQIRVNNWQGETYLIYHDKRKKIVLGIVQK